MTTQDIIKQTKSFTIEQKQQLGFYFLFSSISEDKKQEIMHLFHYKNDFEEIENKKDSDDIYDTVVLENFLQGYSEEDNIYNSL